MLTSRRPLVIVNQISDKEGISIPRDERYLGAPFIGTVGRLLRRYEIPLSASPIALRNSS